MSRNTGPRLRILRALNIDLPGLTRKGARRRETRPGQHGFAFRRRPSEYGMQLREKQIVRRNYGLTERQMRQLFGKAKRKPGVTGTEMLVLLEQRLDNIVFRAGFAPTIPAARQLVNHGHITVNGRRLDIVSALVRVGDTIALRERSRSHPMAVDSWPAPTLPVPSWIERKPELLSAKVVDRPTLAGIPLEVDMQLVVEFYSR